MYVSSVSSMTDVLATQAAHMRTLDVASQISVAVFKQIQQQQVQQAEALIEMIQETPAPIPDGVSQYIDFYA